MSKKTDTAVDCAKYIKDRLKSRSDTEKTTQQINCLLYLSLREGYAIFQEPIFEASFVCHEDGPYCTQLEPINVLKTKLFNSSVGLNRETILILNSVLEQYGLYDSKTLTKLISQDDAWSSAWAGCDQQGICVMNNEQILKDSKKINVLKSLWCMDHNTYGDSSQPVQSALA